MFEHTILVPVMFTVKVESDSVEERQAHHRALNFVNGYMSDFVLNLCAPRDGVRLLCSDVGPTTKEGMKCAIEFYPDSEGGSGGKV